MKGKFMIIAALLGALTFGACVDTEESSSVTAIRNAKAEQLKSIATLNNAKAQAEATIAAAEAQLAAAQAQLLAAEAAALNAETEAVKIANQIAAAQAEAEIAAIEAQLEIDLLTYQQQLLEAKLAFNEAMQQLTADEKANLEGLYTAYNTALENLALTQFAIAEANAEIAKYEAEIAKLDADKNWEDVVKAANKAVTDAQKAVNDTEAKLNAKKAAYADIEAMGGINYDVLAAQIKDADKAKTAALKAYEYAKKNTLTKTEALSKFNDATAQQYWLDLQAFLAAPTLGKVEVDTDYDEETSVADHIAFYPVSNASGAYAVTSDPKNAIVLFDMYVEKAVKDGDKTLYNVRDLFWGTNAAGVAAYAEHLANLLSTSSQAQALSKAQSHLEARAEVEQYEALEALYNAYLEDVAAVNAEIAAIEAEIATLTYQKSLLTGTVNYNKYYENEIKAIEAEITALGKEKTELEKQPAALKAEFEKELKAEFDRNNVDSAKAGLNAYKKAIQDVVDAQKAYDALAATYDNEVALLNKVAAGSEAWIAKYVTAYNEAMAAHYAAVAAEAAAKKASDEASDYVKELKDLWTVLAGKPAGSVEDMMSDELKALAAEIATLEATLKTNKKTLESAQKAADKLAAMTEEEIAASKDKYLADAIKALEAKIEAKEAEIVLLEQDVTVYELEIAGLEAALEDALN